MKTGAPRGWAVSSQEGLKPIVILSLSSDSCEMMQQHLPRPFGQHSFAKTPSLLSLWRFCHFRQEFQVFVSLKDLSLQCQLSSAFSPEKGAFLRERVTHPSVLLSSAMSSVSPLSATVANSPFLKGLDSVQLPGYGFAARGMLLLLPACCLPKPDPQAPDHSHLERPSSVPGFSLTPGFSHKKPCLNPISVCLRQCQACP